MSTDGIAGRISRRRFLVGVGGATLALPFLPSVMRSSRAAPTAPRRFVFVFSANGQRLANWYPTAPQQWKQLQTFVREAPLTTAQGPLSVVLGSSFAPVVPKLLLLRGLDLIPFITAHNAYFPLSGASPNAPESADDLYPAPTIDQVMASSSSVYLTPPPVRSLQMLVKTIGMSAGPSVSVSDVNGQLQPNPGSESLVATYNALFGRFLVQNSPLGQRRAALRLKVMDRVYGEYTQLATSPKLGSADRLRLEAHATQISELEASIKALGGTNCVAPPVPVDPDRTVEDNLPLITATNINLMVAAMRCDLTRVFTLMLSPMQDPRVLTYLGFVNGTHHEYSHAGSIDILAQMNLWYGQQVADLLTKMDAATDVDGHTVLDNSVVYWGNENGCCTAGIQPHAHLSHPVLLAGGAGGMLQRLGRYVDFRQVSVDKSGNESGPLGGPLGASETYDIMGRPYNSLLITLLKAMGVPPAEYQAVSGNPGFGDYGTAPGALLPRAYSVADGYSELPSLL